MKNFIGTNNPECIILHYTASNNQDHDIEEIRRWHIEERGFFDIGYHYVIFPDGSIFIGREESVQGAHCTGENKRSIGIALHGKEEKDFTEKQFQSLAKLINNLKWRYNFENYQILGHNRIKKDSPCPFFSVKKFKSKYL